MDQKETEQPAGEGQETAVENMEDAAKNRPEDYMEDESAVEALVEDTMRQAFEPQLSPEQLRKRKRRAMVYNTVRRVIMLLMLCVFCYAVYNLVTIYREYKKADETYESIRNMFYVAVEEPEADTGQDADADSNANGEESGQKDETKRQSIQATRWVWDYDKLLSVNDRAQGWIRLNGTKLDYPIVQGTDNTYYLTHAINEQYVSSGSVFVDYRNSLGMNGKYCLVYGHYMHNGTMFGPLQQYKKDADYVKEHPVVDIYIEDRHYLYYVYSYYVVEPYETKDSPFRFDFENLDTEEKLAEYQEFLDRTVERSMHEVTTYPGEITTDDYVITLVTCTGYGQDTDRLIVHLVRGEEVQD